MELYILSRQDLTLLSINKLVDYQINIDEETNAKSNFKLLKADGLIKGNYAILNGLYKQFLFIIDEVNLEKDSNVCELICLDISNIFDRKVIEKNTNQMTEDSIEDFIINTINNNFINSDDSILNLSYIETNKLTSTQTSVAINSENGLYNFHTFLTNCRQYKNIFTTFTFEVATRLATGLKMRLKIDVGYEEKAEKMIDTTLPEVTNYNKVKEENITAKVTVYIRENQTEYNLYLKSDRTTTTNKNDPDRVFGAIEVISVETAEEAPNEALNVMKGNRYNHLVEFNIYKNSQLMDISQLEIGTPILIKTDDDVYESYISAININNSNFVGFKSGNLRITLIDKLKKNKTGD